MAFCIHVNIALLFSFFYFECCGGSVVVHLVVVWVGHKAEEKRPL